MAPLVNQSGPNNLNGLRTARQYIGRVFSQQTFFSLLSFASLVIALFLLVSPTKAAVLSELPFEARLTSAAGNNVADGVYSVTFRLYNQASGGTALWSEVQSVTVSKGEFAVRLGEVTPLTSVNFDQSTLYLAFQVGSDPEMSPRYQIGAAPQALNALKVGGHDVSELFVKSADQTVSGATTFTGGVTLQPASLTSTALVVNPAGGFTGNLLDLQVGGTSQLRVDASGAIHSATWQGNVISALYGGTGVATVNPGDILYGGASGGWNVLPYSTDNLCLVGRSGIPAWYSCSGAAGAAPLQDVYDTGNTLSLTNARDLSVTLADTATDPNFVVNIASGSTGKFAVQSAGSDVLRVTGSGVQIPANGISVTGNSTVNGTLSGLTGLTVASGGASITGGVTVVSGNLAVAAGTITASGTINGATISGGTVSGGSLSATAVNGLSVAAGVISSGTWQGAAVGVQYGGTGATSFTSNGLLYGNGSSALQVTTAGTSGQLLLADASGTPKFVTVSGDATLANTGSVSVIRLNGTTLGTTTAQAGSILMGDGSQLATQVLSGDATLNGSTGVLTIAAGSVTGTKIASGTITATNLASGDYSSKITSGTYTINISGSSSTVANGVYTNVANIIVAPADAAVPLSLKPVASSGTGHVLDIYNNAASPAITSYFDATGLFHGSGANITAGTIANGALANSAITVTAGSGLGGGGSVSLGGTVTLTNGGVTSLTGTTNQVTVSGSTGAVTVSLPQDIATTSLPTFGGLTANGSLIVTSGGAAITGNSSVVGTFGVTNTVTLSGTGSNQLAITGVPTNSGSQSLVQIGDAIQGGQTSINGGTYLGINLPASGPGSAADFFNLQSGGTTKLRADGSGNLYMTGGSLVGASLITVDMGGIRVAGGGLDVYGGINNRAGGITNAGAISGVTSLTASGAIQGGSLTDGVATLSSGALTGATSGTFSTSVIVPLIQTASGNLALQASSGIVTLNTPSTQNKLQVFAADGSSYTQLTHDGTNAILSSNTGSLQLSATGSNQLVLGDTGVAVNLVFQNSSTISGLGSNAITLGVSGDTFNLNTAGTTYNIGTLAATNAVINTSATGNPALVINGPSGLTANLLDLQVNGSSKAAVSAAGALSLSSSLTATGATLTSSTSPALSLTGTPSNTSTAGLVTLGTGFTGGNSTTNGGTYLALNAPTSSVGSAADLLNFEVGGVSKVKLDINGALTLAGGNTASVAPLLLSGSWYTGGTGSTTLPQLLLQPSGTTSSSWSTSGTAIGANAVNGFVGNLADLQIAGASKFKVDASGNLTIAGNITAASTGTNGYWSRSGSTLQPTNAGDTITTSGNIATSGSGTITSAGLFTASTGLTVTSGTTNIYGTPTASADLGQLNLGSGASAFSGSGSGYFSGSSNGTMLAVNGSAGFSGNLTDFQRSGRSLFKVDANGQMTYNPWPFQYAYQTTSTGGTGGSDTGGYTDVVSLANSSSSGFALLPSNGAQNGRFYLGFTQSWKGIRAGVGPLGVGGATSWQVCTAASSGTCTTWTTVGTFDLTTGSAVTNWSQTIVAATINGVSSYWLRGTVTTGYSTPPGVNLSITDPGTAAAGLLLSNYGGNSTFWSGSKPALIATDGTAGFAGNLIDLRASSVDRFTVDTSGNAVISNSLTVSSGGISVSGGLNLNSSALVGATNITASGTVQGGTVNATTALQLNGVSINTAGTLTDVAYLDQANTFSAVGTALSVTNNASIGGTLAVTGTINSATISGGSLSATTVNGLSLASGTVSAGTWNGTAIDLQYGGTGITSYTVGDLLYASGGTTLAKLSDAAVGSVLVSGGVGVAPTYSSSPTLSSLTASGNINTTAGGFEINGASINTAGTLSNVAYLNQANTFALAQVLSGTGAAQLSVTGAPAASATSSLVRIGNALVGGNSSVDGGTYLGINQPAASNPGSVADFINFQNNGTTVARIDYQGNLTITGNLTTASSGTNGFWSRVSTTLQPANAGDAITTSGNISTSGTGTITAAAGLTVSAGGAAITGNSTITGTLSGLTGLTVASGGATITSGNLVVSSGNITASGTINSATISGGTLSGGSYSGTALTPTGNYTAGSASYTFALQGSSNYVLGAAPASASYGLLSVGSATTAFDGSTAGHFSAQAGTNGTQLAVNAASGFAGNLVDLQLAGSSKFHVDASGNLVLAGNLTAASTGTNGYWSRSGTTLQPGTAGDAITTSGNISTSGSGTITAAAGLTITSGGINASSSGITNTGAVSGATTIAANNTLTLSGTGANQLAITGTPAASTTSSLTQLGSSIANGNSVGTYLGINAGSGFTGNLLDAQVNGSSHFSLLGNGTSASSTDVGLSLQPSFTETGTGGYTAMVVNPTVGGTGSGTKTLFSLQNSSSNVLTVGANGKLRLNPWNFSSVLQTTTAEAAWTDVTTSANNNTSWGIFKNSGTLNDRTYFGFDEDAFLTLRYLKGVGTPGSATVAWEYCSAVSSGSCTTWTAIADTTTNLTANGDITAGGAPVRSTINGYSAYWFRITVQTASYSVAPTGLVTVANPGSGTDVAFLIQPSGTANATWNSKGAMFGINAGGSFNGSLLDLRVLGTSKFAVTSSGTITANGVFTFTGAAAASTPAFTLAGTWFTGGTATTTKPQQLIEPGSTTSNNWNTNGTGLGVNAASGFTGDLIVSQVAASARFKIDYGGHIITGSAAAPTSSASANLGSTGTCAVDSSSTDVVGIITLTPGGTGIASGVQCTITFNTAWPAAPKLLLVGTGPNAIAQMTNVYTPDKTDGTDGVTTTTFKIMAVSSLSSGTAYRFTYHALQ